MKTRCRPFHCLLLSLLLASSLKMPAYADSPQWVEVRSPHFSVATDAGEKRGREVAMRFEQMRAVFAALVPKASIDNVPLQIVAFRNTKEFRGFAPLWQGKPNAAAGLFQSGEDRSFIMLDMSLENPYPVVFHEYGHYLMKGLVARRLDPWFQEGFAEFFSSVEVSGKEAEVGKIPDTTFLTLQQRGMIKIADLFRVQQNSATYNESGDHRDVFYCESLIVVHYLYENQLIPRLSVYFNAISRNASVDEALQQAFGMSSSQFDKVLQDYVRVGHYKSFPIRNPPNIVSSSFAVAPLNATDAATIMADIHLHSPDYRDKAIAEFQEILKADPNSAVANRGLGYAYLRQQHYDEAKDHFRKAAQLDSKDPRVHYYSAMLMSRDGTFSENSDFAEITKELETAVSLDPAYADAYMLLGFTRVRDGKPDKGLEAMEKAVSLRPGDERYRFNLAQIYMSNRNFDQALAVLHGLENTRSPQLAANVQQTLQLIQRMKDSGSPARSQGSAAGGAADDTEDDDEGPPKLKRQPAAGAGQDQARKQLTSKFMRATITAIDCSAPPAAQVTAVSEGKTWKLRVPDVQRVILFGADKFSCAWANQKAGLNYVEISGGETLLISVQIVP